MPITQTPLACPNEHCPYHDRGRANSESFYVSDGWYVRKSHPYRVQRYLCRYCKKRFSSVSLTLEAGLHRGGLCLPIFRLLSEGLGLRQIARSLSISESLVRERVGRMGRQALTAHAARTRQLKIREPISYDGAQNFAGSQYEPNNVNQAIGYETQFIYDFNFAPLNRRGHMSERQKERKRQIERLHGIFPPDAVRQSSAKIFSRLCDRADGDLDLWTDEHYQYRHALERDLPNRRIRHRTVSGRATRLFRHILFPVNHFDLLLRHHNKAFTRETVAFAKKHGTMIHRYALSMVWKNYFRTQFIKRQRTNPLANEQTPAMAVGLATEVLGFYEFFWRSWAPTQVELSDEWKVFYLGEHTFPRIGGQATLRQG